MNSPRYAQLAAQLLAREACQPAPVSSDDRLRAISVIERSLQHKSRRVRGKRIGFGFMAAAAVVALGVGLSRLNVQSAPVAMAPSAQAPATVTAIGNVVASGTRLLGPSGSEPFLSGDLLPTGGGVVTDDSAGASIHLSTGTELALDHGAKLSFVEGSSTQRFLLGRGSVSAKVKKLHKGERFIVGTPDAEVEVRGTAFRVSIVDPSVTCGTGSRTRVAVSEGVVEVRSNSRSVFVRPGETWPPECTAAAAEESPAAAPAKKHHKRRGHRTAVAVRDADEASSIAEQNALFAEGLAARRQGDVEGANRAFDKLLETYPTTQLGESAAVKGMQALVGVDAHRAAEAARHYLAEYPHGFARSEAEAIIAADR